MSTTATSAFGTWEEASDWVGRELARSSGADPVGLADIRRRLEVLSLDCPLHYDESAAQASGYRTVVAPATMLMAWSTPAYWTPGQPRPTLDETYWPMHPVLSVPAPTRSVFATNIETEYFEPVYPGDVVTAAAVLESLVRKRLSVGDGAFFVVETAYRNQDDELLGLERLTVFRYTPDGEGDQ